ncbi:putative 3-hydroxyphenylpropionic transporter MhpT [Aedoeadaptatus ivorii]|uniref:Putative 3-hydroxyphenylpropionic transporter MhpT n=1 Tax=Aedoeadaptatus ivorii TaxID=54006 RepID=A0A448V126_9FIRM|nr:MFS transporter [Peptoniphilus ivorii]VEJ35189.1 putative 3-hydroxyphenylpropionic transporter MhpT [Peptoniphilus ivorii]
MKNFTVSERNWMLYDVGNSAFVLLVTTILPIYFRSLTDRAGISATDYFSYWGLGMTISTVLIALAGPFLGRIADGKIGRRRSFLVSVAFAVTVSLLFPFFPDWRSFLIAFILAKAGYNASLIFYDSMLVDVTSPENMDRVSATGFAWGYIGSCIPFVLSLAVILLFPKMGLDTGVAMGIVFFINGLWWLLFTLPVLKTYRQTHFSTEAASFSDMAKTLKHIRRDKALYLFLLSFFFYIDGVYTIINMATAYGESLGLDSSGLLLALLVTQIVAFPASLLFARLSKKYPAYRLIALCIVCYAGIALFAVQLDSLAEFWFLAVAVGLFQGGIQSLSRSHFVRLIPPERSGEYFGIFDIFGKGASIIGTLMISTLTTLLGSQSRAIFSLVIMFLIGLFLFLASVREMRKTDQ